jgi:hypothetical protein
MTIERRDPNKGQAKAGKLPLICLPLYLCMVGVYPYKGRKTNHGAQDTTNKGVALTFNKREAGCTAACHLSFYSPLCLPQILVSTLTVRPENLPNARQPSLKFILSVHPHIRCYFIFTIHSFLLIPRCHLRSSHRPLDTIATQCPRAHPRVRLEPSVEQIVSISPFDHLRLQILRCFSA